MARFVAQRVLDLRRLAFVSFVVLISGVLAFTGGAVAADGAKHAIKGEKYVPTIWVDPDGCEHWVFDDGFEGYMTPNLTRDGKPVCRTGSTCAVLRSDQLFATNRASVSAANRARLLDFFGKVQAKSFIINGYTDSRGSDAFNMALSQRRAQAVAEIALVAGVEVFDVRGYGEQSPKASNKTASGRALNRRVEVICVPVG